MKFKEIYSKAIETAIENDPRGSELVRRELEETGKLFEEMKEKDKEYFDVESLTNPYADSRMLNGDIEKEIKKVMVGIDVEGDELLIADRLNEKGANIDLVIGHHPKGKGTWLTVIAKVKSFPKFSLPKTM